MKKIKTSIIFILVYFLWISVLSADDVIVRKEISFVESNVIKSVREKIPMLLKEHNIPGAAIALVDKNGIIWAQGFGVADKLKGQSVNTMTLFSIQSQTKMFTALGVMRAVQSGLVSLNTPISHYLPDLKVHSIFEKDPAEKITLKHLLSHTAGFAHEAPIGNNFNSQAPFSIHMVSILSGTWLQFPMGQGYSYSNIGIDLAGHILEVAAKKPFTAYITQEVLKPLQMKSSTFDLDKVKKSSNYAIGHIPGIKTAPINHSIIPAGGMYSNVIDMAQFLQFQLKQGVFQQQQVLNRKLWETMLTIPFPSSGQTEGSALGIWQGKRLETTYYAHLGRGFGYASNLEWYPEYDIGVVVLTNKYDPKGIDIQISHLILDSIVAKKKQEKMKQLVQAMLGEYISNGGTINIVQDPTTQEVRFQGTMNDGPTGNNVSEVDYPLSYVGQNQFYSAERREYYLFEPQGSRGTKTLQRVNDGYRWFYNQSKNDPFGPNKSSWQRYEGVYHLSGYGTQIPIKIFVKNGYLYMDNLKLKEFESGVFSTANGQMLVFRDGKVLLNNLSLVKQKKM